MITIILAEPENDGNIGAIARAMKNFGMKNLVLINPKCDHLSEDAIKRSKHAKDVLRKAKVCKFEALDDFDVLVGTTAIIGSDYNITRLPITPKELAQNINPKADVGILIGREGDGLNEKELNRCDFIVSIPSSKEYPTLNISHACAIIFYELFQKSDSGKNNEKINPATKKDKDAAQKIIDEILDRLDFTTQHKKETQKKVWKRVLAKSFLAKREYMVIMGFFKKVLEKMKK